MLFRSATSSGSKKTAPSSSSRATGSERPSQKGQLECGADKRVKGHKRHIDISIMELLLAMVVQSAGIQDRVGAKTSLVRLLLRFAYLKTPFCGWRLHGH